MQLVSRGADTSVSIGGLTRADLYSFAFVFLGLYFILSSFADVINWIHYFVTVSHNDPARDPHVENLYQLTRPCLTFVAGLVSLIGAPHWTKKLVSHDQKAQVAFFFFICLFIYFTFYLNFYFTSLAIHWYLLSIVEFLLCKYK